MSDIKPSIHTCLSPALLHLYPVQGSVVVIIDILRATSTITTALQNGAEAVIPVKEVEECVKMGTALKAITAGERDGQVAPGLQYGNSPFEYDEDFIKDKTLVLTTTNGTKLLHMALQMQADQIVIGSFCNVDALCTYLLSLKKNIILGCAAWKDKVNIEDTLFAGAVLHQLKNEFSVQCDASQIAATLYEVAKDDMYAFMKAKNASHYHRLTNYGLTKDIQYCLKPNTCNVVPVYKDGKLNAAT